MTVELYYFQPLGTNSGRVYQALLEKEVEFVERELKGTEFEHLKPAYLKVNPKGQVPTLVHDGRPLPEGMIANEYIDEAFEGPPLRPSDLRERWRMRVWQRYAENDLGRALMMINWNRIVPGTIRAALRGNAPVIRSDGSPVLDYFYVEDGAAANMHLARSLHERPELAGEAFNFSNAAQVTVSEIVALILQAVGRDDLVPVVQDDAPNEIAAQYLDPSKAERVLGWRPEFELPEGLARTIEWYRAFLGANVG